MKINNSGEKGSALVLVILVMMTLTMLGVGVITSTVTNHALSKNYEVATQAQNMADIGAKVAYREFINSGFLQTTHTAYNGASSSTGDALITTSLSNYEIDSDGWFKWEWDSNKAYDPMWETNKPHGFRFRVYYYTNNAFVIESEGWYGSITKRTRAKGAIETMFQFSYFASRDLGEFTRGSSQQIRGKVHANGNMYIRPDGSSLYINTSQLTATGYIIRTRDAWGRPDGSGSCYVSKDSEGGTFVEMTPNQYGTRGNDGSAIDSFGADWNDINSVYGAKKRWGGVVRDKVPYKSPPPLQSLDAGGYYETLATTGGLVIDQNSHSNSWCKKITIFYNYNEQRYQTIWDVNIKAMRTAGSWPSNNLIYCKVPIRLSSADSLGKKLMVASCRTIYTKGDFNTKNKQGAAIMTKHRVYHLSSSWKDTTYVPATALSSRPAVDTQINAAIVDGAPTVDEYNWVDRDGDHKYDYNNQLIYDNWSNKKAAEFHNPANSSDPWANCDDLIEDWNWGGSKKVLHKLGSVVHLNNSNDLMCSNLDNSGITDEKIAWVRKLGYDPPDRYYEYDPDLATASGQPPFTPLIGHISSWEPY